MFYLSLLLFFLPQASEEQSMVKSLSYLVGPLLLYHLEPEHSIGFPRQFLYFYAVYTHLFLPRLLGSEHNTPTANRRKAQAV
jgi:hypothetical protein